MFFLLGFLMGMAGLAMLVQGACTLPGRRRVTSRAARIAGGIWLTFFPIVLIGRLLMDRLQLVEQIEPWMLHAAVAVLCLLPGIVVLLRGSVKQGISKTGHPLPVLASPYATDETVRGSARDVPEPPAGRSAASPFDFS